jgi:hypothetical protein
LDKKEDDVSVEIPDGHTNFDSIRAAVTISNQQMAALREI